MDHLVAQRVARVHQRVGAQPAQQVRRRPVLLPQRGEAVLDPLEPPQQREHLAVLHHRVRREHDGHRRLHPIVEGEGVPPGRARVVEQLNVEVVEHVVARRAAAAALGGEARADRRLEQREEAVAVEVRRRSRELRPQVLHKVLDEVALPQQYEVLDVRAVLPQHVLPTHQAEQVGVRARRSARHEHLELLLLPVLQTAERVDRRARPAARVVSDGPLRVVAAEADEVDRFADEERLRGERLRDEPRQHLVAESVALGPEPFVGDGSLLDEEFIVGVVQLAAQHPRAEPLEERRGRAAQQLGTRRRGGG